MKQSNENGYLYNPNEERDACGVGFVVNVKGVRSNKVNENSSDASYHFSLQSFKTD